MGLLDTDLDITVEQLDKVELLRLIKMSTFCLKDRVDINNIVYHEPSKQIKNKFNYLLEISFDPVPNAFYVGWNLNKSKGFRNKLVYQVIVKCTTISTTIRLVEFESRNYVFDNFEQKFQNVLKEYNITL